LGGCSHTRGDAEIAAEVQSKINSDQNIATRQVGVTATDGVVTLSGTVGNEFDRSAAGGDAAQIAGVKTVVNNLQVAPSTDAMNSITPGRQHGGSLHRAYRPPPAVRTPSQHQASETVTVPQGTLLSIRLVDAIDSERAKDGDTFHGTLEAPVTIGDTIVIPKYADVEGQVVQAKSAAHFAGQSELTLELTRLQAGDKSYSITSDQYTQQGAGRGKRTAEVIGGGAGAGALIGGLTGGGKGALIGAALGAGAGTGVQAMTHGQQVRIPSETVLQFHLNAPISVQPSAAITR